jgi:Flp pilus assembly protein TadB
MYEERMTNDMLAKLGIREWVSILGSILLAASVATMGYSNLLRADEAQTVAIVANTKAMLARDKNNAAIVATQNDFNTEIQTIQLRLQAIEINQNTRNGQQDRIEKLLNELVERR